jgi:hypothetical protein
MAYTNLGLIEYAKAKMALPNIYFLSGIGRRLTEAMIQKRIAMGDAFTINANNQSIIRANIGDYAFDCGGMIKAYLWETAPGVINYNVPSGSDQNAGMMYRAATAKGTIDSMPDLKGLLVFTADLGHVGLYVGRNGAGVRQYIECTPAWGAWGITTSADSGHPQSHNRKWTFWGKYALIEYIEEVKTIYVDRIIYVDKIVEKIVEVDRPIDETLTNGSITAHIKRG